MQVHISDDVARHLNTLVAQGGYRTPDECVDKLLRAQLHALLAGATEQRDWLSAQQSAAAKVWDNDADTIYDQL